MPNKYGISFTTVCLKKTGPLQLIWYNFNDSQHLQTIFGKDRPYLFLRWMR